MNITVTDCDQETLAKFNKFAKTNNFNIVAINADSFNGEPIDVLVQPKESNMRTAKVLHTIAHGGSIVTEEWLSIKKNVTDEETLEKYSHPKWKMACKKSMLAHSSAGNVQGIEKQKHNNNNSAPLILTKKKVCLGKGLKMKKNLITSIIKSLGGEIAEQLSSDIVIVNNDEDVESLESLSKKQYKIMKEKQFFDSVATFTPIFDVDNK